MRILQLTDTHLFGEPDARHYDRIDTAAALRAVLARGRGMEGVDVVVHTGDASDDGTPASYRLLHEILDPFVAELGAPLVVTMGNHDTPAAYAEVAGPGDHGGPWQDRVHDNTRSRWPNPLWEGAVEGGIGDWDEVVTR